MFKKRALATGLVTLVVAQTALGGPWFLTTPNPTTAPNHFTTTEAIPYAGTGPDNQAIRIKVIHQSIVEASTDDAIRMDGTFGQGSVGGE